ncbi:MAG TPA: regulatory protein GemA [Gammaproteobacteria bacterium]|nr:regulatory protein GemA [Gammaproteobacteria bacterium]
MSAAPDRRVKLAKIHVAKKQLGMEDDAYRAVICRVTGQASAGACTPAQLDRLLAEFKRLGFDAAPRKASVKPWVRKIYAIWNDLRPLLDQAEDATLAAFVSRQTRTARNPNGIDNPEWLGPADATPVIQGLEGWLARERAARQQ